MTESKPADLPESSRQAYSLKENVIKFGSIVYISAEGNSPSNLIADGFVDNTVYCTQPSSISHLSIYRGLYIILPEFNNDLKYKVYKKLKENEMAVSESVAGFHESLSVEYLNNIKAVERSFEDCLSCTQPFQLLHISSNKFLTSTGLDSISERENKMVSLESFPNDKTLFYLSPIYMHQSDRDNFVSFDEEFYIVSRESLVNQKLYLHISGSNFDNILIDEVKMKKNSKQDPEKIGQALLLAKGSPVQKFEINLSISEKHKFTFHKYDTLQRVQSSILTYGCLISIHNIEFDSLLIADKERTVLFNKTSTVYDGLWVIENLDSFTGVRIG